MQRETASDLGILVGKTVVRTEWVLVRRHTWEEHLNMVTLSAGDRRWPVARFDEHDEDLKLAA